MTRPTPAPGALAATAETAAPTGAVPPRRPVAVRTGAAFAGDLAGNEVSA
jgi:hypothetical protein